MPDRAYQVVLADHSIAAIEQVVYQVKDLGLDRYRYPIAAQLATVGIKRKAIEMIEHASPW